MADGKDVRQIPLTKRRALLQKLLGDDRGSPIQFSDEYVGNARALFKACAGRGAVRSQLVGC